MSKKKTLKRILEENGLELYEAEARSLELCEPKKDYKKTKNLILFALDVLADDFKMNVINYVDEKHIAEKTGLTCISKIEVDFDVKNGVATLGAEGGKKKEFNLIDYSDKNIKKFIKHFEGA